MHTPIHADVAVVIGRFQPFHRGHARLLRLALATAPQVVVILGSSFHARSANNPFTWQERAAMIGNTMSEDERARVTFAPMRDYYDDARWVAAVEREVARCAPQARQVALVGHFKDASSYYLNRFSQWQLVSADNEDGIDATSVRRIMYEAEDVEVSLSVLIEVLPPTVRQYLKAWTTLPHYAGLVEEYSQIKGYTEAWRSAPYAPIFSTADAIVRAAGQVLLIRRGGFPGKGQWALPGGFVEPRERVLQSAIRELGEETHLAVLAETLVRSLVDVKVFDHPDRSQRGRTITHAHYFDLDVDTLPNVEASDDAAHVAWVAIDQLAGMEELFFEDHFHILDQFLGLTVDI